MIRIRPAEAQDYPRVEALWQQQNAHHAALVPSRMRRVDVYMTPEEFALVCNDPHREIALATTGEAVDAAALLVERHHDDRIAVARSAAFVQEICVGEHRRRAGIGRALMRYAERWAEARRLDAVELNVWAANTGAMAFYQALGFTALRLELTKAVPGR